LSGIDEYDKKSSGRIIHVAEERIRQSTGLGTEASNAQETKYAGTNQMAPSPPKKLQLQTNTSSLKPSN